MDLHRIRRDKRLQALLAAPALALALAACGGDDADVSAAPADEVAATTDVAGGDDSANSSDATDSTDAAATDTAAPSVDADGAVDGDSSEAPAESSSANAIERLSAEEAIANAEVNQPGLQSADNVADIEVLAVADGSAQSLRQVVDGDRPVLLWFYAPH